MNRLVSETKVVNLQIRRNNDEPIQDFVKLSELIDDTRYLSVSLPSSNICRSILNTS